jgi:membrane fusion protein (multidrug efflux system)
LAEPTARRAVREFVNKAAIAGIVVAVAAVGGASYWAGTRSAPSPAAAAQAASKGPGGGAPQGTAVEATTVEAVKLPSALAAVGSLRSDETIVVRPEIAGRVAEILFREGERVTRDQVLLRLDGSVQKADTDRARANLVLQKSKYDRAVDLRNKGFISSQAKDEAENNLKVSEADLELAQARLGKMEIRAPFAGTIGLRQVSVGDYVKEGQDMVNLESLDPLKVDFRVPEIFLSQVRNGQSLQITLDALPDKAYPGQVYAINPLLDAAGRSVVIRATVPNPDGRLRAGMFARVRLLTSELKDAIMIPEESLFPLGDDKYVYRVIDGRARRQKVEIGLRREGKVEIVGGLSANDVVVTAGHLKIRDGTTVRVATSGESGAATPKAEAAAKAKGS